METDNKIGIIALFVIIMVPLVLSTYLPDDVDSKFSLIPIPEPTEDEIRIEKIKADVQRVIDDIIVDQDGNRIVGVDDQGLPFVNCTPFENEEYSIDKLCKMVWK